MKAIDSGLQSSAPPSPEPAGSYRLQPPPPSLKVSWTIPFLGILGFIFVVITYRAPVADIAVVVGLAALLMLPGSRRFPSYLRWLLAFVLWAALGSMSSRYFTVSWDALVTRGKFVLITFLAVNAIRSEAQGRIARAFVVLCFLVVPARVAILMFLRGEMVQGRVVGPFIYANPNDLAGLALVPLACAASLAVTEHRRPLMRAFGLVSIGILLFVILITKSRGAFLGIVAMVAPFVVVAARRRPKWLLGFAVMMVVGLYTAPAGVWNRIAGLTKATDSETIRNVDPEGSGAERLDILRTGWQIFLDNPILGVGLGAFPPTHRQYDPARRSKDTHNTYLNVAAEAGLPGFVIFLGMIWALLRHSRRARAAAQMLPPEETQVVWWVEHGLIAFLVAAMFATYARYSHLYVYMALLWAEAEALRRRAVLLGLSPGRA